MRTRRGLDRGQFGCDAESLRNFGACVGFFCKRLYAL